MCGAIGIADWAGMYCAGGCIGCTARPGEHFCPTAEQKVLNKSRHVLIHASLKLHACLVLRQGHRLAQCRLALGARQQCRQAFGLDLHGSVGAGPLPPPGLLFPDAVCPEAYEEHGDNLCAPRQIAAILKRDLGEICDELREAEMRLSGTDTVDQGVTSRVILEFCKQHGLGAAIVHNERVIETIAGSPVLAWTVHEAHCWFYSAPQVRRAAG